MLHACNHPACLQETVDTALRRLQWRDCAGATSVGQTTSAAFTGIYGCNDDSVSSGFLDAVHPMLTGATVLTCRWLVQLTQPQVIAGPVPLAGPIAFGKVFGNCWASDGAESCHNDSPLCAGLRLTAQVRDTTVRGLHWQGSNSA